MRRLICSGTKSTYDLVCDSFLRKGVTTTLGWKLSMWIMCTFMCSPFLLDIWLWHLHYHAHLTSHHISHKLPFTLAISDIFILHKVLNACLAYQIWVMMPWYHLNTSLQLWRGVKARWDSEMQWICSGIFTLYSGQHWGLIFAMLYFNFHILTYCHFILSASSNIY